MVISELTSEGRAAFVREHTALTRVPLVPSIEIYTATELVPLWRATSAWLIDQGIDVPFWCAPWAGGQALARWVLDHPEVVAGREVVDFGTGSGLVGIAAAMAGARRVRAVDLDPLAIVACELNAKANGVARVIEATVANIVGDPVAESILLAGDVWYERAPSARFGVWFAELATRGTRVITGDPGRAYVPTGAGVEVLAVLAVPTTAELESATERSARILEILPARPRS